MNKFIMLSGPSCVGKGPLYKALQTFYPDLVKHLKPVVLYNSRTPRPGEKDGMDYHFRPRAEIEEFAKQPCVVSAEVRGDLQAIEITSIKQILESEHDAFFEGNPFIPAILRESGILREIPTQTIFLSPLSKEEICFLRQPEQRVYLGTFLAEIMRRKLLRRTKRQKTNLSLNDLENIERRATSAITELREAWKFDYVIPNHDGEDSEHWDAFYYPIGDARQTLLAFTAILCGENPPITEHWEKDLVL
jgi:guanylate kinase